MTKSKVSIVKTPKDPNYEQILAAVQKAVDLVGGIRDIVKPGQKKDEGKTLVPEDEDYQVTDKYTKNDLKDLLKKEE